MNLCSAPAQLLSQYQVHQVPEREAQVFGPPNMAQDPQGIIPEAEVGKIDGRRLADFGAEVAEERRDATLPP